MREILNPPSESLIFFIFFFFSETASLGAFSLDLDFWTISMGDCSPSFAADLSLAKNQKIPVLSNQPVEEEGGNPHQTNPTAMKTITI